MANVIKLAEIVEDLIQVVQTQTTQLEKLVAHIEQSTGHLREAAELGVVRSELSALHLRTKALREAASD
jgi:hypothetical protein